MTLKLNVVSSAPILPVVVFISQLECSDITFAEAFLGEEVMGEAGPSPASGADRKDFANEEGPYWLVEQKRAQSVVRFSGTLNHPSHFDKTGLTIVAFAHYVYCYTKKNMVLADIQGKFICLCCCHRLQNLNRHARISPRYCKRKTCAL